MSKQIDEFLGDDTPEQFSEREFPQDSRITPEMEQQNWDDLKRFAAGGTRVDTYYSSRGATPETMKQSKLYAMPATPYFAYIPDRPDPLEPPPVLDITHLLATGASLDHLTPVQIRANQGEIGFAMDVLINGSVEAARAMNIAHGAIHLEGSPAATTAIETNLDATDTHDESGEYGVSNTASGPKIAAAASFPSDALRYLAPTITPRPKQVGHLMFIPADIAVHFPTAATVTEALQAILVRKETARAIPIPEVLKSITLRGESAEHPELGSFTITLKHDGVCTPLPAPSSSTEEMRKALSRLLTVIEWRSAPPTADELVRMKALAEQPSGTL